MPIEPIEIWGLIAGIFISFSGLPQIIKVIKRKQSDDVSISMFIMLIIGGVMWLIYGIANELLSIVFWNAVYGLLNIVAVVAVILNRHKKKS